VRLTVRILAGPRPVDVARYMRRLIGKPQFHALEFGLYTIDEKKEGEQQLSDALLGHADVFLIDGHSGSEQGSPWFVNHDLQPLLPNRGLRAHAFLMGCCFGDTRPMTDTLTAAIARQTGRAAFLGSSDKTYEGQAKVLYPRVFAALADLAVSNQEVGADTICDAFSRGHAQAIEVPVDAPATWAGWQPPRILGDAK